MLSSGSVVTETDSAALVSRCLAGDGAALREFVERFQQRVFGLCLRMLGHRQEAEDVAQESLVRAVRYLSNWDESRPLGPWVLTIAANRCRTARAARVRRHQPGSDLLVETPSRARAPDGDLAEELDLVLQQLREEYRECFILFYQQELSIAEVSEMMSVPEGTVKTWLHRARKELALLLTERGLAPIQAATANRAK